MTKIEELQVIIGANTDQLKAEIGKVSAQLSGLQKTSTQTGNAMGGSLVGSIVKGNIVSNILLGTLRTIGVAFVNVTKAIGQQGSEYSRLKVATDTITANLGMTAKEVNGLRDSLADANTYGIQAENVIKTLALSGLVDLASGMQAVDARTGKTVDGVQALVLQMKDLSASAGIDSAQGIERLTKFIRRGEATFADGIIEVGNLNREYRAFADARGKDVQQLTAEELAEARLNIVRRESIKAFGAYANTMQTSAKAYDSFSNATINSAQLLGNMFEPALSAMGNALFQFANGVRQSIIGSESNIRAFANKVAGYVVAIIRIIGTFLSMIPVIGANFKSLATFTMKPIKAVGNMTDKTKGLGGAMKGTAKSAKDLKKELAGLAGFDEMQVLQLPSSAGGAGGGVGGVGGAGNTPVTAQIPDFSAEINKQADAIKLKLTGFVDTIKTAFGTVKTFIQPVIDIITKAWSGLWTNVQGIWKQYGGDIMKGIGDFIENIKKNFTSLWENVLKPLIQPALDAFRTLWADTFVKIWSSVTLFLAKFVQFGLDIYNKVISPIGRWLQEKLLPVFTRVGEVIGNVFGDLLKSVGDITSGIFKFLGGVIDFITGVFTGNWRKAWNGVKDIFGGVFDALKGLFRIPINFIIDGLNRFFGNLNFRMPEWIPEVGGKGFTLPQIPRLASGGIVSSPTVAMVGEAGREAVIPLDGNQDFIEELANKLNGANSGQPMQLIVKLGEDTVYNRFVEWHNDKQRLGGNVTLLHV